MKQGKIISLLVFFIALMAIVATIWGISGNNGRSYTYISIRGETVSIYGKGLYRHMSAEVAPQGIAQDYVTLFAGVPLLLASLFWARRGSLTGLFLLAGTLGYFLVTYLFYFTMAMYNILFLGYVLLLGLSFFSFILVMQSFSVQKLSESFGEKTPVKSTGIFLMFNAGCIAFLWLNIVLPPLLDGTIIPAQTQHYTTLIVQGFDLGILLPAAFITGLLFLQRKPMGYLLAPVYFVFLSLLMTALTGKIIAMALFGYPVIPVIFIIPAFNLTAIVCCIRILKSIRPAEPEKATN